jgi:hypothetical protein
MANTIRPPFASGARSLKQFSAPSRHDRSDSGKPGGALPFLRMRPRRLRRKGGGGDATQKANLIEREKPPGGEPSG